MSLSYLEPIGSTTLKYMKTCSYSLKIPTRMKKVWIIILCIKIRNIVILIIIYFSFVLFLSFRSIIWHMVNLVQWNVNFRYNMVYCLLTEMSILIKIPTIELSSVSICIQIVRSQFMTKNKVRVSFIPHFRLWKNHIEALFLC